MAEPIVFVSHNRIKEGRAEDFRTHYVKSVPLTLADKPGTLAQLAFENEQGTEVTVVRMFPSADALDSQLQGADARSKKTYEFIQPVGIEIFGTPNPATLDIMKEIAGSGVSVRICPRYMGGFVR